MGRSKNGRGLQPVTAEYAPLEHVSNTKGRPIILRLGKGDRRMRVEEAQDLIEQLGFAILQAGGAVRTYIKNPRTMVHGTS